MLFYLNKVSKVKAMRLIHNSIRILL